MTQFDPKKAGDDAIVTPSNFKKPSGEGWVSCLCKTPIPPIGTHRFSLWYTEGSGWEVRIGLATAQVDLNDHIWNENAWSYSSGGSMYLNGVQEDGGCEILDGSVVEIEVSLETGVVGFYVNEEL